MFSRTIKLIGKENFDRISQSNIIVFGVGGVGGYVVEMLVRAGVGKITIVDFDSVSITNKNRQIIALDSTMQAKKVDVMKDRILDINPLCEVTALEKRYCANNKDQFNLQNYDYVIDCIDSIENKLDLIEYCCVNSYKIISSMGAGKKFSIPNFEVLDIFKTSNDNLAKKLRYELKKRNVKKLDVICDRQEYNKKFETNLKMGIDKDEYLCNNEIGSISYYPAMCGCTISAYVVNQIIKQGE